ncbi:glycosyltransferase [Endozoicomonadaceae bacterium StTr2]
MTRRIRVLQLQPKYYIRETDLHEEVIRGLPVSEFEVTSAYMRDRPGSDDLVSISEHSHYFGFSKKQMSGLRLGAMKALYDFCKEKQFDVVVTNRYKVCDMMLTLNKLLKIPRCISVVHGFGEYDRISRRLGNRLRVDGRWKFVTVSAPVRDYLLGAGSGFYDANVRTINNAIDIDKTVSGLLSKAEARQYFNLQHDDLVIGAIGRLVNVKGHRYLLQTFHQLSSRYPQLKLLVIGEGERRKELEDYISQHGLQDKVLLPGHIESAYRFIPAFDVFTLPSLSEGLPLSILESMAARVPVVASDVGGVASVLDGISPVVEAGQVEALEQALESLICLSGENRQAIGVQLRKRLNKEYSITGYRQQYRDLISGVSW